MESLQRRKKLIFWRIEQRLKQKDIAEKLGVTLAHYSNLERGTTNPSYELLVKFNDMFKVKDILDLFEREEIQNGNKDTSCDFGEE